MLISGLYPVALRAYSWWGLADHYEVLGMDPGLALCKVSALLYYSFSPFKVTWDIPEPLPCQQSSFEASDNDQKRWQPRPMKMVGTLVLRRGARLSLVHRSWGTCLCMHSMPKSHSTDNPGGVQQITGESKVNSISKNS